MSSETPAGATLPIRFGFWLIATFLIFMTLKLAQIGLVASWSWWWVTCPLWIIPLLIAVVILCVASCGAAWFLWEKIRG